MKKIFKGIKKIIIFAIIFLLLVAGYITLQGYNLYKEKLEEVSIEEKINEIKLDENYTAYDNIPKDFVNALVAIEDRRFFYHKGVDVISVVRAAVKDFKEKSFAEGGSTITQQLAKNMYFSNEKSLLRKVAEVFVAYDLEKNYSKEDILEIYMNIVYFGDGHYGIKEASLGYFKKQPKELDLYEITLLAGLPNAPSAYALSNNTKLSNERQDMVIDAMVKNNYITEEEASKIKNEEDY